MTCLQCDAETTNIEGVCNACLGWEAPLAKGDEPFGKWCLRILFVAIPMTLFAMVAGPFTKQS